MKVRITKLKELEDALHPNNIPEGYTTTCKAADDIQPVIGERFTIFGFSTSAVQEILSDNTFRTYSSIYKWEVID